MKIWKSKLDLTNVTGTFYHWCQWCNYAPTTKWIHKTFKELVNGIVCSTTVENWRILKLLVQSLSYTGASQININRHIWQFEGQSKSHRVLWSWAFQDIFIHGDKSVFICYIHILNCLGNLIIYPSRIFMSKIKWIIALELW